MKTTALNRSSQAKYTNVLLAERKGEIDEDVKMVQKVVQDKTQVL